MYLIKLTTNKTCGWLSRNFNEYDFTTFYELRKENFKEEIKEWSEIMNGLTKTGLLMINKSHLNFAELSNDLWDHDSWVKRNLYPLTTRTSAHISRN